MAEKNAATGADPIAWLRHGEETPVQNVPFGAMWISDKSDPRAFPVYDRPEQTAPSVAVKAEKTTCKNCGGNLNSWFTSNRVNSMAVDGRLKSNEISCNFVLGCDECSETLRVVAADEIAGQMNATLSAQVQDVTEEQYRHKKRGSTYTVTARGRLQVDGDLDNEKVVVYRGEDEQTWVRPEYEFHDGRFEPLPAAPAKQEGK
ncbi:hypothetical protein AGRO_2691 [Agrobacterium sp. ATCC 31749]|uniref:hypothetical protein n=1 Tax=unclassified Agrobacterium TaxID=2632611 RepID=UPI00020DBDEC|nr:MULTISPECIES: hypothetical protein [unclassified Agrobacterium]EGL64482.1 hypothetical protein AGRO_2691 [Agrobacterium sp. ATCC 31749]